MLVFTESLRLQCNGIETEELLRVQIHARIRQRLAQQSPSDKMSFS